MDVIIVIRNYVEPFHGKLIRVDVYSSLIDVFYDKISFVIKHMLRQLEKSVAEPSQWPGD